MANITYEMEKLLAKLSQEQDSANKEMKNLPEGRISSVKRNGVDTFFRVDEKRTRKSINKDENMIRALARKKYLHSSLNFSRKSKSRLRIFNAVHRSHCR